MDLLIHTWKQTVEKENDLLNFHGFKKNKKTGYLRCSLRKQCEYLQVQPKFSSDI